MRFRPLLFCLLLLCAAAAPAQEPPLPQPDTQTPPPPPSVPQLIPDDILPAVTPVPSVPSLPQLDEGFKDNPLSQAAADHRARLEWRKLRNRTANDPAVKAAWVEAEAARTDLEKRKLLRRYYDLLFAKMVARASSPAVLGYLNDRKNEHLNTLPQPRVRPESAKPTPSPRPAATAAPQASASPTPAASVSPAPPLPSLATPTPDTR